MLRMLFLSPHRFILHFEKIWLNKNFWNTYQMWKVFLCNLQTFSRIFQYSTQITTTNTFTNICASITYNFDDEIHKFTFLYNLHIDHYDIFCIKFWHFNFNSTDKYSEKIATLSSFKRKTSRFLVIYGTSLKIILKFRNVLYRTVTP